jgi:mono/diheme cytochrome c family protein
VDIKPKEKILMLFINKFRLTKINFSRMFVIAVLAWAFPAMALAIDVASGDNQAPLLQDRLLALHDGEKHGLLAEDHEASGICPQERKTARAPDKIYHLENPLKPTTHNLVAGETLFKIDAKPTVCRVCHGFSGNGMGILFQQLSPKPRNFTCYFTMTNIPDGQLFWIIKNGSEGTRMPSFGYLSDAEVWQLVLYIRKFAP